MNGCIHLVYYEVLKASSSSCPHCKECKITNNGYRKVKVKIPSISDKPAILYLHKHRFICKVVVNPLQLKLLKLESILILLKIYELALLKGYLKRILQKK